ncbi:unnamed protein product [Closterium sp. NIES-53]
MAMRQVLRRRKEHYRSKGKEDQERKGATAAVAAAAVAVAVATIVATAPTAATAAAGTVWSLRHPFYGLLEAKCEWHNALRTSLAALGFSSSSTGPSLFVCSGSTPYYILVYQWSAAKRVLQCLASTSGMELVLGGRQPVTLEGHSDALWADDLKTRRSTQSYYFSLGARDLSWRSAHLPSVDSSSCETEIYACAMASRELCWLTFLLSD